MRHTGNIIMHFNQLSATTSEFLEIKKKQSLISLEDLIGGDSLSFIYFFIENKLNTFK